MQEALPYSLCSSPSWDSVVQVSLCAYSMSSSCVWGIMKPLNIRRLHRDSTNAKNIISFLETVQEAQCKASAVASFYGDKAGLLARVAAGRCGASHWRRAQPGSGVGRRAAPVGLNARHRQALDPLMRKSLVLFVLSYTIAQLPASRHRPHDGVSYHRES